MYEHSGLYGIQLRTENGRMLPCPGSTFMSMIHDLEYTAPWKFELFMSACNSQSIGIFVAVTLVSYVI